MRAFDVGQEAFEAGQRASADTHAITDSQERAGLMPDAGGDQALNREDFFLINRGRNAVETDDLNHARSLENWEAVLRIEAAEQVAREQRRLEFLDAV